MKEKDYYKVSIRNAKVICVMNMLIGVWVIGWLIFGMSDRTWWVSNVFSAFVGTGIIFYSLRSYKNL